MYEGNNRDGSGDFMSIIQKDGYLEFRFDTGSGMFLCFLTLFAFHEVKASALIAKIKTIFMHRNILLKIIEGPILSIITLVHFV